MVSTIDVPFEIWHSILRDVYSNISAFPHLDHPRFVLSELHRRSLLHRNLSLISKHLHTLSSTIFLEELHINQPEALVAVSRLITRDPNVARVIRKLWFNFYEYRCGASSPRRPRQMKDLETEDFPPDSDPVAQAEVRRRNSMYIRHRMVWSAYLPSMTNQSRHWRGWIGLTRTILSHCKSVKQVSIDATADYSQHEAHRNARGDYRSLFGSPDLNCDSLISGLLEASNLHVLRLKNPSPLDPFGTALGQWSRLREVEIEVSRDFPEARRLSDAIFCPPASLRRFTLMNRSKKTSLPATSDLSRCTSLSTLELGVLDLADTATLLSAQFLISNYQHSLRHLKLEIRRGARDITGLLKQGALHFPVLKSLEVCGGTCHASLFTVIQAEVLQHVALHSMDVDGHGSVRIAADPSTSIGSRWTSHTASLETDSEEYWEAFFSQPTLANLESFHIQVMNPSVVTVMRSVCSARGIDPGDDHAARHLGA